MAENDQLWAGLPTETEIYILPSGEIVVADLPAELAAALASLSAMHQSTHDGAITDQNETPKQSHVPD